MTNDISRLCKLAGIMEDFEESDARYFREQKIIELIKIAFNGLPINEYAFHNGIFYDEKSDREASVSLDDTNIELSKLLPLMKSGLADDFVIKSSRDGLTIDFHVSPELDNAIL